MSELQKEDQQIALTFLVCCVQEDEKRRLEQEEMRIRQELLLNESEEAMEREERERERESVRRVHIFDLQ